MNNDVLLRGLERQQLMLLVQINSLKGRHYSSPPREQYRKTRILNLEKKLLEVDKTIKNINK